MRGVYKMKLAIIGGSSATTVKGILGGSTDTVETSIFPSIENFMDMSVQRNMAIDRVFLMQEAYDNCPGDKHAALTNLYGFLINNYPDVSLLCLGSKEPVLQEFANVFLSPEYVTISVVKASARFICDCAIQSVDKLLVTYASLVRSSGTPAVAVEQPVSKPAAQTNTTAPAQPAQKQDKKRPSIFSKLKNTSTNAGHSPAAPLTPSQNAGLGQNQDSSGSFSSGVSGNSGSNNINPFGNAAGSFAPQAGDDNPFNMQPSGNPFGQPQSAPARRPAQPANSQQSQATRKPVQPAQRQKSVAQPAQSTDSFEKPQSNINPFGNQQANTNPFGNPQSAPAASFDNQQANTNPFGNQNMGTPDFSTPSEDDWGSSDDSWGNADSSWGSDSNSSFEEPSENNDFQSSFGSSSDDFGSSSDDFGNSFGSEPANFGASGYDSSPAQSQGQFGGNTQSPSDFGGFGNSDFGAPASNFGNQPVQNQPPRGNGQFGMNPGNQGQNFGQSGLSMPAPDFGGTMGTDNFGATAFGGKSSMEFMSPPVVSSNPAPAQQSSPSFDRSRLQGNAHRNNYDFAGASQVETRRPGAGQDIEEAAALSASPFGGMLDDSAYQQQFAPKPKVVERIVEREVYVDAGTDIPVQKLLDAGKHVIVVVTGDRRSGVTYTSLLLASLYARKYATLLVDFDSDNCGSQFFQEIDVLYNEHENVRNGTKRLKNPTMLHNLVHHDLDTRYDFLYTLVGTQVSDQEMRTTATTLLSQQEYNLIVIDCPWTKLHNLEDMIDHAKILICVDGNEQSGCYNIVRLLGELPPTGRLALSMDRNAAFVAKHGVSVQNLLSNMKWVSASFQTQIKDWAALRIIGSAEKADLPNVMAKL